MAGTVVTLKLKTARFQSVTRRRTLQQPVQLADALFHALEPLLEAELAKGAGPYRLIGAGISALCAPGGDAGDLLDAKAAKRGAAERASDIARARFGADAVQTGRGFRLAKAREKKGRSEATSLPGKIRDDQL
jgi:DNA polymerase-4